MKKLGSVIHIVALLIGLIFQSCGKKDGTGKEKGKLLAEVKQAKLYAGDLTGLVPLGASKADSTELVIRYINSWVKKQLILNKARNEANIDEAEIERKLLDYKYDLIAYEYEKAYIKNNLDTVVNEQEITKYYQENQPNFVLKQNIIRGILIKIPADLPEKEDFRKLLQSQDIKEKPKLKEYAIKFASFYQLNDTSWVEFDSFVKNTPFHQISNKADFLKRNSFTENNEDGFIYLLKINEYKTVGEISTQEYVKDRIVNMIINQRKVQLTRELEQKIYKEAEKNNAFKIFN